MEALEPDRLVRLRAEMKLPGRAWLQFRVRETGDGTAQLEQTAAFLPKGLGGLLYWYGLYPVHAWIFDGLAREIAKRAEAGYGGNRGSRHTCRSGVPPPSVRLNSADLRRDDRAPPRMAQAFNDKAPCAARHCGAGLSVARYFARVLWHVICPVSVVD